MNPNLEFQLNSIKNIGLTSAALSETVLTDEPKFPAYIVSSKVGPPFVKGYGIHHDKVLAELVSHAECLERICCTQRCKKTNSETHSGPLALVPDEGTSSHIKLLPSKEFSEGLFTKVHDIIGQSDYLIPDELIYINPTKKERIYKFEVSTTGAAFGEKNTERAFISGLLELIERDALANAFYFNYIPQRIKDIPLESKKTINYIQKYGLKPYIFDITTDIPTPTVLVITIDTYGHYPKISAAAACRFTYAEAISKALLESVQSRISQRLSQSSNNSKQTIQRKDIISHLDRASYWSSPNSLSELGLWTNTNYTSCINEIENQHYSINTLMDYFKGKNYPIYIADLTVRDIAAGGFEVLKVICPDLHPLAMNENMICMYSNHLGRPEFVQNHPPHPII